MKKKFFLSFGVIALLLLVYLFSTAPTPTVGEKETSELKKSVRSDPANDVAELINNEELIRQIDPILADLKRATLNLQIQNAETFTHFSRNFQIRDINSVAKSSQQSVLSSNRLEIETGELKEQEEGTKSKSIWAELLKHIVYFDHAKFYAIKIADRSSLPQSFTTKVGFESLGRTVRDTWLAITATGKLKWKSNGQAGWEIEAWDFEDLQALESEHRIFEDATLNVFSQSDYRRLQHSDHHEILVNAALNGRQAYADQRQEDYFPRGGITGEHPSISIVDVDDDGWDDLYVVEPWGKNLLFRNQGDGTFHEVSGEYELDLLGESSSCLFADFDNDGDQDLFLGRILQRSMYLENVDGKFVDRSQQMFEFSLPFLVTAVSASDYNGDGLIDLYLSTYGFPAKPAKKWTREFLNPEDGDHVLKLHRSGEHQRYINAIGPKNILLENSGNGFVLSRFDEQVATWANSFQGTWADYDNDGDPDLYVANDFARDYLFRNDREDGFKDVTLEVGDETMMGFGMGASWGDYDLDGRLDLYVSNMYSKAGLRITEHFGQLDKRFRRSADGNRLYQNSEGRLRLVSANESPGLNVHKAGWSWGGQFMDFDNDGFLDLYVCSGYFTAPKLFATELDL